MHSNDFEEKFDAFLEDKSYDLAAEALFHVVRAAFTAGWVAAGGTHPNPYLRPGGIESGITHAARRKQC